jgi:hypothetical protein
MKKNLQIGHPLTCGYGESLSELRNRFSVGNVDTNTTGYSIAHTIGAIEGGLALGGTVGLLGKGRPGFEYSHFIPQRYLNPFGITRSFKPALNGTYVPRIFHALTDSYRYRFLPRALKAIIGRTSFIPQGLQQALRIPPAWIGGGLGATAEPE